MLLFAAALTLVAAAALAGAAALRLPWTATVLAAYLFASAEVVLLSEVLSPFHAVGAGGYLGGALVVAAIAALAWRRAGSPRPRLPRVGLASLRRHPLLLVLGMAVAAALVFEAVLVLTTAPNNWDGMTYHLSRAAAWYHAGAVGGIDSHTLRERVFPPNAELQVLFTMAFVHGDRLAAAPQFVAELALLVGIFGTARRLGFERSAAAFAALLFATLSEVALQATSTQNDLVVSAYVVAAAFFILGRTRVNVLLAGLSIGLALGTKLTAVYALPVLLLLAIALLPRRRVIEALLAGVVSVTALGGYVYVANVVRDGSPLGPPGFQSEFKPEVSPVGTSSTFARLLYRFVDISGYEADLRVNWTITHAGESAFNLLRIDPDPPGATLTSFSFHPNTRVNEDISYFGPLGAFLVLPLALGYVAVGLLRRAPPARALLALGVPLVALEIALTYRYNPWIGRFMLVPVALAAALAARVYAARIVSGMFVCCGLLFLAFALAHNERKPVGLRQTTPVWSLSRSEQQALANDGYAPALAALDDLVPADATIGYVLGEEDWDYPLYGARLARTLVRLHGPDPLAEATRLGIRWIVVGGEAPHRAGWASLTVRDAHWTLLASSTGDAQRLVRYARALPDSTGETQAYAVAAARG